MVKTMNRQTLIAMLKGLSGETRLAILTYLKRKKGRSSSVSTIANAIHRSDTVTSLHLLHLQRLGILERRRRGHEVYYRLSVPQSAVTRVVLKEL